ncbi:MAG: hypothetical protein OEV44_15515, partial [Spirochaetota bacterium]|nr:hypothetical protein [Spirochaetota bacterium]
LRKVLLICTISLLFTNLAQSKDINKFIKYGISFDYSAKYKITPSEEKGYKRIIVESTVDTIIVDIYPHSFKDKIDKVIKNVMSGVVYSFRKDGFQIKESKMKRTYIKINDSTKKEKVKLEASIVKVISQQKDKDSIKSSFYFFSYKKKGYIISYSHLEKANKNQEFVIFTKSFTVY